MMKLLKQYYKGTILVVLILGVSGGCVDSSLIHHSKDDEWKQQQGIEVVE